jgi:hypothetical protein
LLFEDQGSDCDLVILRVLGEEFFAGDVVSSQGYGDPHCWSLKLELGGVGSYLKRGYW